MSRLLTVGNPPIEVKLRRSARARRFLLRISQSDGTVTLTLPTNTPETQGIAFLWEKEEWLRRHLKTASSPVKVGIGTQIPFRGELMPIITGSGKSITVTPKGISVPENVLRINVRLKSFLKVSARDQLVPATDRFANLLGYPVKRITMRDTKSRWGSCTSQGHIMYSWRLIMAPPEVLEYVAAHEVAHLKEMNHSKAFWNIVKYLYPEFKLCQDWLKAHGNKLHRYDFDD